MICEKCKCEGLFGIYDDCECMCCHDSARVGEDGSLDKYNSAEEQMYTNYFFDNLRKYCEEEESPPTSRGDGL